MNPTNSRILEEAEKLFAQKSFSKTSIHELAKVCNLGVASLYHYYSNKDEILFAVLQRNIEKQLAETKAHLSGLTHPLAKLEKYIWFQFYFSQANPDFSKLILCELRHRKELTKTSAYQSLREIVNHLIPILQEGQQQGIFKKEIDSMTFRNMVWGTLEAFTRNWLIFNRPENIVAFAPFVTRSILTGISTSSYRMEQRRERGKRKMGRGKMKKKPRKFVFRTKRHPSSGENFL